MQAPGIAQDTIGRLREGLGHAPRPVSTAETRLTELPERRSRRRSSSSAISAGGTPASICCRSVSEPARMSIGSFSCSYS